MPTFGQDLADAIWSGWDDVDALTEVTLTTTTGQTIDHTTGVSTPTVVTVTVDAIDSAFRPDEVDGIRITALDRKVLLPKSALATAPAVTSTVAMHGQTWTMKTPPEPVANDGLWQLHVRQVGQV